MNRKIKNIIFDLGGVIINIDYKKTEQAFVQSGVNNFRELYSQFHTTQIFEELEKGIISAATFISEVKKVSPVSLEDHEIIDAWNAMLLDLPSGRLNFLYQLKNTYRTFLLSNTNEIHYEAVQNKYKERMNEEYLLNNCFEKAYYSHELNLRKPDVEIFNLVIEKNNLQADETLFIDDTPANIEGARKAGLNTCYLSGNRQLETLFSGYELKDHLISSKSM